MDENSMSVAATQAALTLEARAEDASPHEVISLLLDGALERIEQARTTLAKGDCDGAGVLIGRVVGIVNGLRDSLDIHRGGDIAVNLDSLYDYISTRLCAAEKEDGEEILQEAAKLLDEVKEGWDAIAA